MTMLTSFSDTSSDTLTVAIIGATGGIGSAIIEHLAHEPTVKTLYCGSRAPFDTSVYENVNATVRSFSIDITNEVSVKKAAEFIADNGDAVDVVIVATGLLHDDKGLRPEKSLQQLQADNFLKNMLVNALGPALVAKHFLPLINKNKRSFFGAFSARVGSISDNGLGGWHSYRASKAANNMLIKNIAIEYKRKCPYLIVAGLHPGTVDTELSTPFQKNVKPEKLFTPEFSAKQILSVIDKLSESDSGNCFAWDGRQIPA